jgi:seryl-tRNA synthetase
MADGEGVTGAVETTAIVHVEEGEPTGVHVELPAGEEEAPAEEPAPEPAEEPASEAVEIAEIEAARDVVVAEIAAKTAVALAAEETARIEAANQEEKTWQNEAEELRTNLRELKDQVDRLFSALPSTRQPSPEAEPEEAEPEEAEPESPVDPAMISITASMSEGTSETPMEATPASAAESREPEAAPAKRRRRPI